MAAPSTVPATPSWAPITAAVIAASAPPTSWVADISSRGVFGAGGCSGVGRVRVLVSVIVESEFLVFWGSGEVVPDGHWTPLSTPPNVGEPPIVTHPPPGVIKPTPPRTHRRPARKGEASVTRWCL